MSSPEIEGIDTSAVLSGPGCVECLSGDGNGWWMHLRRCAQCGHIGCCDSSPSQHGTRHAQESGHPFVTSLEPDEEWFWNDQTRQFYDGRELAPPLSHPESQPVPGPAGRPPADWRQHLHA